MSKHLEFYLSIVEGIVALPQNLPGFYGIMMFCCLHSLPVICPAHSCICWQPCLFHYKGKFQQLLSNTNVWTKFCGDWRWEQLTKAHVLCMFRGEIFIWNFPLPKIFYAPWHYCDPLCCNCFPWLNVFPSIEKKEHHKTWEVIKRHRLVLEVIQFTGSFVGRYKAHCPLLEKETYALYWQSSSIPFFCVL